MATTPQQDAKMMNRQQLYDLVAIHNKLFNDNIVLMVPMRLRETNKIAQSVQFPDFPDDIDDNSHKLDNGF